MNPPQVLLIDDTPSMARAIQLALTKHGYEVTVSHRGDEGLKLAETRDFDVVITDFKLPGLGGLDLLKKLQTTKPRLPIILVTGYGTTDIAIESTKLGAYEYLQKPFQTEELLEFVKRAVASGSPSAEVAELTPPKTTKSAIIGQSRVMQTLFKEIGRIAAKPVTVLIQGSTGTGKELMARAIYQHSDRLDKPFITVNCASIPETLLESEFFGHERGAFTGAVDRRIGRFEQADGGTLFLDEIGDITLGTQAKLLRVLQERTVQRLGSQTTIPVDVRVIAATHQDLEKAVQEGRFREDLYYRLKVVVLRLPDLKDRRDDIPELVGHFLRTHGEKFHYPDSSISKEALQALTAFSWPGNVRELENVMREAILQSRGYSIQVEQIEQILAKARLSTPASTPSTAPFTVAQWVSCLLDQAEEGKLTNLQSQFASLTEKELYTQAYERAGRNQVKAAKWLGVSRPTMHDKLSHFGLLKPLEFSRPEPQA